jgi:AraC-like DNA-binding protein
MDSAHAQQGSYEAQRAHANREELVARVAQATYDDGRVEPLRGLYLFRASAPTELLHSVYTPALCVLAQGRKEIFLGKERYHYDPAHYLLTTVELPVVSQIREASRERPYLSIRIHLDPTMVGAVLVDANLPVEARQGDVKAMDVGPLDAGLLDAVVRLVKLVDCPTEARVIAPLVMREIIARLLLGAQGARLRHLALLGGFTHHIARAIDLLRKDYHQPLRMEHIAQELGISVSGFHHQFKAVTAMSPLQYQKRLRLQEARRLMLGEHLDAASAGYRVGYDDASHFNREYKSLFGLPPLRDVERLRGAAHNDVLQEAAIGQ